jgi:hypothetical protein
MAQQTSSTGVSGNNHQVDMTLNNANRQGEAVRTGNTAIVQDARSDLPQSQQTQQTRQLAMPSVSYRPPPPSTPPPFCVFRQGSGCMSSKSVGERQCRRKYPADRIAAAVTRLVIAQDAIRHQWR